MISTKALSELLSQNSDGKLCKRWCLMTLNGTLLAYTEPAVAKVIRKLAATAALSWHEHEAAPLLGSMTINGQQGTKKTERQLYALTIEMEASNVLVRRIQSDLLLVLEGGIPPRRRTFTPRTTAEDSDGEHFSTPRDTSGVESPFATSLSSKAESSLDASTSVLALHRKKLDAMVAVIATDFERTGFKMPDESVNKFF